jgi:uncharacterized membrane protein
VLFIFFVFCVVFVVVVLFILSSEEYIYIHLISWGLLMYFFLSYLVYVGLVNGV